MYPPDIEYCRPDTIEGALDELSGPNARVLAGGHSLLQGLKQRALDTGRLVDIGDIDALQGIEFGGDSVRIGAATRYAAMLADDSLSRTVPGLIDAVAAVGDRQIRNRGTIGGNLVQADPGADIPPAAMVADAEVTIAGPDGERSVLIEDLYSAHDPTGWNPAATIAENELLTSVSIPIHDNSTGAYVRKTHQSRGYATIGVAVQIHVRNRTIKEAHIAATGLRRAPVGLTSAETALVGHSIDDSDLARRSAELATEGFDPDGVLEDPNVSASYRVDILGQYVERALDRSFERISGVPAT